MKQRSTQFASHWQGPHHLNIIVLAVADGLFGLYASERWDKLLRGTRSPLFPVPNKPYENRARELCESRDGRPGLYVLTSLLVSVNVKQYWNHAHALASVVLIWQPTSEDIKQHNSITKEEDRPKAVMDARRSSRPTCSPLPAQRGWKVSSEQFENPVAIRSRCHLLRLAAAPLSRRNTRAWCS